MKLQVNKFSLSLVAAAGVLALAGCGARGNKPNVELIQDMMVTPAVKAQSYDEGAPHHRGMRVPPEKTAPVGMIPYKYMTDLEGAIKNLRNPYANQMDPDTLLVGQKYYETNCAICHGFKGEGGVAAQSAVVSDKVKAWPDAHLYHVIAAGQGVMGPYASHIPQAYRWQVVNYIRFLEKQAAK
jgi:hypothetical protein